MAPSSSPSSLPAADGARDLTAAVPDEPSVLTKLVDAHLIIDPLERGAERVNVVVDLVEPTWFNDAGLDWESTHSARQYEAAALESAVLATLTAREFRVRHLFENQAAISGEVTPEGLAKLLSNPSVQWIEPVYAEELLLRQGISLMNGLASRTTYNGQGVAIAICDTGLDYTHAKLGGGSFPNAKVIGGYDFGDNDPDPMDLENHGTACAGIAAGDLGDSGDYIGGVAYGARLYALKVGTAAAPGGTTLDTARALDWCVTHKNDNPAYPILVFSRSAGSARYYSRSAADSANTNYARAVRDAVAAGITVVAGSGNDGYCDSLQRPAALTGVLAVGAVYDAAFAESYLPCVSAESCVTKYAGQTCSYYAIDHPQADVVPSYSNTASFLDLLGPANRAYTLDPVGTPGASTGDYNASFGGTSAACPYAAGAVACLQSASKAVNGRYLSPAEVRAILTSTGDSITDTKPTPRISTPRVNLGKAIASLIPTPVSSSVVIDDMESYTDEDGKEIFTTWIDGWSNNTGSQVGYLYAPFAERMVVHGGAQSLPLAYDNTASPYYSEAERAFASLQNWTSNGSTDLSLWVRGYPAVPSVAVTETGGRMSLTGDGADIWGTSDQFVYAYKTLTGDGFIIARVISNGSGSNPWAKGGVMIRDSLNSGSAHAMQIITGGDGNGASFQWRPYPDYYASASNSTTVVAPPYWVKIERAGDTLTGSLSADGVTWQAQGTPQTITMTAPVYIGVCVTSHAAGEPRTFQFDNIKTSGTVTGSWRGAEIGSFSAVTSTTVAETGGKMSLTGRGTDIWHIFDQFVYAYKTLTGDGSMVARVISNGTGPESWAKGGVMIRDSLYGGSAHAMQIMTGGDGNGASFQWRSAADWASGNSDSPTAVAPPYWVKIERVGNTLTGSLSADGYTWRPQGTPQTIAMTAPVYIGLCVTSHTPWEPRTFQFDNIRTTGGVSGAWQGAEIVSPRYNSTQPLYVRVEDSTGRSAVVTNAAIVNATAWTEWRIPLASFTGVNVTKVRKLYIGVGSTNVPAADGEGLIYLDDLCAIRR